MGRIALVTSGYVRFNSKATDVDGVWTSELNLIGKIGAESVFSMERDDQPDGPPDTEKEGHTPDMKAVKSDKADVDVYQ